jgi:peptide methionine sulfoxide reductase MsrB
VEEDWQRQLTPLQFRVLRQRQTEDAGSGEHTYTAAAGRYSCAGCGLQLYDSKHKFTPEASVHGWPAFFDNIEGELTTTHTAEFPCSNASVNRTSWESVVPFPTHRRSRVERTCV